MDFETAVPAGLRKRALAGLIEALFGRPVRWVLRQGQAIARANRALRRRLKREGTRRLRRWYAREAIRRPGRIEFDPLEQRLVLNGDLTPVSATIAAPVSVVPAQHFMLPVEVKNAGPDIILDPVAAVYGSVDGSVDGGDTLLGQVTLSGALNPNETKTAQIDIDPSKLSAPGTYSLIAVVDPTGAIAESDETNNTLLLTDALILNWRFQAGQGLSLTDGDGTQVTFTLTGAGVGEVTPTAQGYDVAISGSNAATAVTATTLGGDGRSKLHNLSATGSLHTFSASKLDLTGDVQVTGTLAALTLGNIAAPHQINVGGSGVALAFTAGHVMDLGLSVASAIASINVQSWQDLDAIRDVIKAPSIGTLTSAGAFNAGLELTGAASGFALTSANIAGAITGGLWNVQGRANQVKAQSIGPNWEGSFTQALQTLTTTGNLSGQIATPSIQIITVGGDLKDTRIYAGANLGSDGQFGGTGAAADTFTKGTLARLRVTGKVINSQIYVGVNPVNGEFNDGNDQIAPGSGIQELIVGQTIDGTSQIIAGVFPATVRVNGVTSPPGSQPALENQPQDTIAPTLSAALATDTGAFANDGLTNDAAVNGTVVELGTVAQLLAKLDAAATFTNITARLQPDKSFSLDLATLNALAGGTLLDGAHVLHLRAVDGGGNSGEFDLAFTLDTAAPNAPLIDLNAASDSGASATDNNTNDATPTLDLTGEADATIALFKDGIATGDSVTGPGGQVTVSLLADGSYDFSATATDLAGNVSNASSTVEVTIDTLVPFIPNFDLAAGSDTAPIGDQQTTLAAVTLEGITEALAAVELLGTGAQTTADGAGAFHFDAVALALGGNIFTVQATDTAGNSAVGGVAITRVAGGGDVDAPVIAAGLANDTGSFATDGITSDAGVAGSVTDASPIATFMAGFDATPINSFFDIFAELQPDGTFLLSMADLAAINGGPLAEGAHVLHLRATDASSNTSALDLAFTLDTAAPNAPLVDLTDASDSGASATDNVTNDATPTIALSAEADAAIRLLLNNVDQGTLPPGTSEHTFLLPIEDVFSIKGIAIDVAGNESAAGELVVTLDTTRPAAPTVALDQGSDSGASNSDGVTNDATPTLNLQGEAESAIALFKDGIATGDVVTGPGGQVIAGSLADGSYSFTATTTDLAGNVSDLSSALAVTIDTLAPATPSFDLATGSDTAPIGDQQTTQASVTLEGATEALAAVELLETGVQTTADGAGAFHFDAVALALGANAFTTRATDLAGNSADAARTFTRTAVGGGDNEAPTITAGLANDTGADNSDGITQDASVAGTVLDASAIASFVAGLDGTAVGSFFDIFVELQPDGQFALSMADLAAINGGTLADGPHVLHLRATDVPGNTGTFDVAFTLDTTVLIAEFGLGASSDTGVVGDGITSAGRVMLTGTSEAGALLNLGAQQVLAGAGGVFQLPDVSLADGLNQFTLHATDAAGNAADAALNLTRSGELSADAALTWNQQALEAIRRTVQDPPLATRILAILSIAQYDAVAAIEGTPAYLVHQDITGPASAEAALAQAGHDVLYAFFPSLRGEFDSALAQSLAPIADGAAKANGIALGQSMAAAVLALRAQDGSGDFVDYTGSTGVGMWRPTAPMFEVADQPHWGHVTPFALTSADQFRPDAPPALDSDAYAAAVEEIRSLGEANSATRTADQTQTAQFWADGKGSYTPPGHWNVIAQGVARDAGNSLAANARLFAQLNVAMADAAIAAWDAKYAYGLWRPIDAINDADLDGNPATIQEPGWTPLLITPFHPEYVSGHSTFSSAAATVLGAAFGADTAFSTTAFTLPGVTRNFTSFMQAAQEAGRSRIYGGIHFEFANQAGQALGQEVASAALARFALTQDTQAPGITAQSTPAVTNTNITLAGQIIDNLSGVAQAQYRVDNGSFQTLALDNQGHFSITTALTLNGTNDGLHTISISAMDAAGNSAPTFLRSFTLDTVAPVISLGSILDNAAIDASSRLTGTADPTGSSLTLLNYEFDGGQTTSIIFNNATGGFDAELVIGGLSAGSHALTVTAADAAGNEATLTRSVTLDQAIPFTVTEVSPVAGASDVGVTYRPTIGFSRPVDPATLTQNSLFATGPDGQKIAATIVPAEDGTFAWLFFTNPLPGASVITIKADGNLIRAASDQQSLDGDGDGLPGGLFTRSFSTVSTASIAGTTIIGKVVDPGPDLEPMTFDDIRRGPDGIIHTADDVFLLPIAHAKVFILGRESNFVFTDANGEFELDNVPSGNVKVAVDGRTATNAPAGIFFPEMVMDVNLLPGITQTVMGSMGTIGHSEEALANQDRREVYLPRVQTNILQTVSNVAPTTITVDETSAPDLTDEERLALTLTVEPGSAIGENGQALTDVQIGISTVPPELVRDMLPPGVLQHTFDITIQAPGVATFAEPLQITFPNVFNSAPGEKLFVLSFDHTTGRLVINGTATVSADGLTVVSDPDSGIKAPGWHGLPPPGPEGGGDEPQDDEDEEDEEEDEPEDDEPGPGPGPGAVAPPSFPDPFDITLIYPDASLTATQQAIIRQAADRWEEVFLWGLPDVTIPTSQFAANGINTFGLTTDLSIDDITIFATASGTDGVNNVLASGSPTGIRATNLPYVGTFRVDTADVVPLETSGGLFDVVLHEMGHVLGLILQNLINAGLIAGNGTADPRFTGATATAEYNNIFGLNRPDVPIDATSIPGTATVPFTTTSHLREEAFDTELMTPFIDATNPLSRITIARLQDLGYSVVMSSADVYAAPSPLPPASVLIALGSDAVEGSTLNGGPLGSSSENFGDGDGDGGSFVPGTAAPDGQLFDFGTSTSVLVAGYNRVTPTTLYSAAQGYGWLPGSSITAADHPGNGANGLTRDFNASSNATFAVDVANGVYDVYVTVGDATAAHNQQQIFIEGNQRASISTTAGEFISNAYRVIVADGQLRLRIAGANGGSAFLNSLAVQLVTPGDFANPNTDATGRFAFAIENLDNGFVLRGTRDLPEGGPLCPEGIIFSPNTTYRQWVLNIDTLETGVSQFTTPPSGQTFFMPFIIMGANPGVDSDGDGLDDVSEFILATNDAKIDTDGDGLTDLAEIQQGFDPLGGLALPTGVIATVALQGQAKEVVVEGSIANPAFQTAYVATGTYGLAIVDALQFTNPILVSQLDLPGDATDVSVDSRVMIAAVASGAGGLHLVNVADPQNPALIQTISGTINQVEVIDGIAYAAAGSELRAYDMLTGERVETLAVPGAVITGLAREGSTLYTLDSSGQLRVVDISTGAMLLRGSAAVAGQLSGKLFVGNGIAYIGAEFFFTGGFSTVDVSDPDAPVLVSGADDTSVAGRMVVANGSGLLVAVGNPGGVFGTRVLDVLDASNPANTGAFLARFNVPAAPLSVALGGGIAFVADGTSGLQIVNYLPFDNLGVAPVVNISSAVADVDPGTPGIQVLEGSTIPVRAVIDDDVQVRNTELLVNGQVVDSDLSFPFDFTAIAPNITAGSSTVEIRVRATDTGGNATTSAPLTLDLVPDTFAPTITSVSPADGAKRGQAFRTVVIKFSEAMDESTLTAGNLQLIGPAGPVAPTDIQVRNGSRIVQLTYATFADGTQQISINQAEVKDRAGNAIGAGIFTSSFTIVEATAVFTNATGNGFWDDAANWDGNVLPIATDDVLLDFAGGGTVTFRTGNVTIRSLSSANPFAITGGTLTVTDSVQVNGAFTMAGGTLKDAVVIAGSGGQGITGTGSGGTLNGVTVNADIQLATANAFLRVVNGFTLNGTAHLSGSNSQIRSFGNQTFGGAGTIAFEGTTGSERDITIEGTSTLTLASTFTVSGGLGRIGIEQEVGGTGTLVNNGLISADVAGQTLTVAADAGVTNNGAMEAINGGILVVNNLAAGSTGTTSANGSTLTLGGAWSNTGTINVTNSTLNLGGTFTTAGIGTINRTGGVVNLTGTLSNAGATLTLNAATGSWEFFGTIDDGTVTFVGGSALLIATNNTSGTFTGGVTLNGDLTVSGINAALRVSGGLTLNGVIHLSGSNSQVRSFGNQTFDGAGTIAFEGTGSERDITIEGTSTLTLASTFTVSGGLGRIGLEAEVGGTGTLVNNGLISADVAGQTLTVAADAGVTNNGAMEAINGGILVVNNLAAGSTGTTSANGSTLTLGGAWSNTGTINVTNSTLNLGGTFTTAGIGTINRTGGVVNLTGTLSNAGATLTLNAATGSWEFFGTIDDGTVTFVGGSALLIATNNTSGTFTGGVTLNGDLTVSGINAALRVSGGLTLNGVIHLSGSNSQVRSFGNQTFDGAGTIAFEGTGSERDITIEGTSTLTLASTFTVSGGLGRIGLEAEVGGTGTLVNNGLISADVAGQTLTVAADAGVTNNGAMEAINGGILVVNNLAAGSTGTTSANGSTLTLGGAWSNTGTINVTNSTLNLGGTFTTAGIGTINRTGGVVNLTGTLSNAGATLTLNAATGSWEFFGTIDDGTVTFVGGSALLIATNNTSGTFTGGVTLNGDLTVSGINAALRVSGGLTLNGVIHLSGSNSQVRSFGNQTFDGAGTIAFEGTGSERDITIEGTSTLTLASTFTVSGGLGRIGLEAEVGGTGTLVNNGLISADVAGQTLTVAADAGVTNNGAMEAINGGILVVNNLAAGSTGTTSANGSTLTLGGAWSNTGTINVTNSTLNLGGTFTTAGIGTINRTGGVVNLTGTLSNAGATLTLNAATGSWEFFGTIDDGTVTFVGGSALLIATNNTSGTFTGGVTLNGDLTVSGINAALRVSGGLTLNGVIHLSGSNSQVRSFGNQTFDGAGTIAFEGTGSERDITIEGTSTLTLASTFTVSGGLGRIGLEAEVGGTGTLVNNGLISADVAGQTLTVAADAGVTNNGAMEAINGGILVVNNLAAGSTGTTSANGSTLTLGGAWSNTGTINVTNSTLNLGGTFTTAGIGTINRTGGVVNLTGTLSNAGATLTLNAATGSWEFFGTIDDGTVTLLGGSMLLIATNNTSGTFTGGVTLNGDLTVSGINAALRVSGGLTLNGVIHLSGSNSQVRSFGNQTFDGAGTIAFEGTGSERDITIEGTSTLTLASTFTVSGGLGRIGLEAEVGGTGTLVNNGLISADVAGQTLTVAADAGVTNNGAMEAINGGILTLLTSWSSTTGTLHLDANAASTLNLGGTFTTAGIGTISRSGGVVNLTGTLSNAGATLTLNATTGSWNFLGTVNAGTVVFAGGATLLLDANNVAGTFTGGVTLNSDLTVSGTNAALRVSGGLTLNGVIHLSGSNSHVRSFGNQTFGGAGTIAFEGTTGSERDITIEGTSTLTLASTFTVSGGLGRIGIEQEVGGTGTLVNNGLISANVAGQTLTVAPDAGVTSNGTLEAINGGILTLLTSWSSTTGTLHLDANAASTLNLGGTFTTAGIGTISRSGGVVNLTGTLNNTGATLTLNATTGSWNFLGTVNAGTVVFAGGATLLLDANNVAGTFTGGVTLNSDLTVSGTNAALRVSGGLTLNGVIHLSGSNSHVRSFGNQTFGGAGTIAFEGTTGSERDITIEGTSTLTLASTFTVSGGLGRIGIEQEVGGTGTLVNNGLISANVAGQTLTVAPDAGVTSNGTLEAINGGILTLLTSWSSTTGTLHLDANAASTLNLGGTFTTAGIGTISRSGGVVNLTGTLNNTGATLTLNATTGSWNFLGTVNAGTVVFAGGATLLLDANNVAGTFTGGVTLNSDLTVSGTNAALRVSGGLTLNGVIHLSGSNSHVRSFGNQTFGGAGTIAFEGTTGSERDITIEGTSTLTLASTFTVSGGLGRIGIEQEVGGTGTLVNNGLISANVAGQTITIAPDATFTNAGVIEAAAGATVAVTGNYTQASTGVVRVAIGGLAANQFGRVTVTGAANLDGALQIRLVNGFVPTIGQTFAVLTYGSRTGQFATVVDQDPGDGIGYSVIYNPTNAVVTAEAG